MDIKKLFNDDDAVSPVIGVILMVAITVILAAVIASFVLGLGNQTDSGAPTTTIGFDYSEVEENSGGNDYGVLQVSHEGGETLNPDEIYFRGTGFNSTGDNSDGDVTWDTKASGSPDLEDWIIDNGGSQIHAASTGTWNESRASGSDTTIVSGDFNNVYVTSDHEIDVVYQTQEGDTSATLNSNSGPDA
ncbi:type IV pilin [Halosimplex salinum]|uniref:type IV pilin n=1 Tax=Halosimplex salinum TaxID=1710538 RepID=UPI000F460C8A|nr:type IV pilin N-terminal domain-containing protein [Halosimplex salinum]